MLVQWAPDRLADVRATPNGQAYPAKYGEPVGEIASKVYKIFAGEDWLFENEGAIRVGDNKIIGVLKKAYRPATHRRSPAIRRTLPPRTAAKSTRTPYLKS